MLALICATTAVWAVVLAIPVQGQSAVPEPADLVILNATIYTMTDAAPEAEALAVKGGRIVAVGTTAEMRRWTGPTSRIIDGTGLTVTPGFIESHGHLMGIGFSKKYVSLSEAKNYEEAVHLVAEAVARARPGEWIVGGGWHQSKWNPPPADPVRGFPRHGALSAVSPDNPVFLTHASGHAALVNALALEKAGIGASTAEVPGGEIIRDQDGEPTGVLIETAQGLVASLVPQPGPETAKLMFDAAVSECLSHGITTFVDAAVDRQTLGLYQNLAESGGLPIRIYAMLVPGRDGSDIAFINQWLERGPAVGIGNNFLTVRTLKLFVDGALGSRGAWLLKPYSDDPGNVGEPLLSADLMYQTSTRALHSGFQIAAHAIGDRANREVLDAYERAFTENPIAARDARFRVEHAQHISAMDIPRFGRLGVVASMQGIHMSSDISWAIDRLGPERIAEGAYVWQKLLKSNAMVLNGTDAPVEPEDPIANFYASVTRKTLEGTLYPWSHAEQAVSRYEALRSYTSDAAYATFEEKLKGTIEPGKLADLSVFTQDLMTVPEEQILRTKVAYTIIGGEVRYRRE